MPYKEYVPSALFEFKEFFEIYSNQDTEIKSLSEAVDDLLNQCFVGSATWGLSYWERLLGIAVDESKPKDFRRSNIRAKLRGSGTITVTLIKNVAGSFSNGEVEVTENIAPFTFEVRFIGARGIPPNLDDLKRAIAEIKPAHLSVVYTFTYNTYDAIKTFIHSELDAFTHEEIRTMKV